MGRALEHALDEWKPVCVFHWICDLLAKQACFGFYDARRYASGYLHGDGVCTCFLLGLFSRSLLAKYPLLSL